MNESWGADTVLMPVPLRWAGQVADYLEGLRSGREKEEPPSSTPAPASVAVPGQGKWTESMVEQIFEETPYQGVVALLSQCAERSGEWVAKAEVEEAEGISPIQLRNELGAFSKLTRRLFGDPTWPLEWKKEKGKYFYRMPSPVAAWWIRTYRRAA